jgi:hypothetical protein
MIVLKPNPKNWKLYKHKTTGEIATYYDPWYEKQYEAIDNFVFEGVIVPKGHYRGRSAAGFAFECGGAAFVLSISKAQELLEALASGEVRPTGAGFLGRFTFFKQGANYSAGLYHE